jgi:hypothetical protein
MNKHCCQLKRTRWSACLSIILGLLVSVSAQTNTEKIYRGSLGDNHIEMTLRVEGNKVTGVYSYDQFRRDLRLAGTISSDGKWELVEFAPGGKKSGKFVCQLPSARFDVQLECEWTKPSGKAQTHVALNEQHLALPEGLRIIPRVIFNSRTNTTVSYPQFVGKGATAKAHANFNRRIAKLVTQAIKDFGPEPPPAASAFDSNYNILLANDGLVSVEMSEYSDSGGAHPNTRLWAFTYDLLLDRELKLDDLFKANSNYQEVIKKYCVQDINRQAEQIDLEEARLNGKPVEKREDPVMLDDGLPEIYAFAVTPDGIAIYFDFPHVMAVFSKVFVPYSVVREHLASSGPAGRFLKQ